VAAATIRKLISKSGNDWMRVLPFAQLAMNTRAQARSGSLPFEIMFNRSMLDFRDYKMLPVEQDSDGMEEWLEHQKHIYQVLFPVVAQKLQQAQEKSEKDFRVKHRQAEVLLNGTTVMLHDPRRESKNLPPYVGPYTVVDRVADGLYVLVDKVGRQLERNIPIDQLKPLPKASMVNPEEDAVSIASGPLLSGYFYVDELLKHRELKGKHQYLVKWKGYPLSDATWVNVGDIDESLVQDFMCKATRLPSKQRKTKTA